MIYTNSSFPDSLYAKCVKSIQNYNFEPHDDLYFSTLCLISFSDGDLKKYFGSFMELSMFWEFSGKMLNRDFDIKDDLVRVLSCASLNIEQLSQLLHFVFLRFGFKYCSLFLDQLGNDICTNDFYILRSTELKCISEGERHSFIKDKSFLKYCTGNKYIQSHSFINNDIFHCKKSVSKFIKSDPHLFV